MSYVPHLAKAVLDVRQVKQGTETVRFRMNIRPKLEGVLDDSTIISFVGLHCLCIEQPNLSLLFHKMPILQPK